MLVSQHAGNVPGQTLRDILQDINQILRPGRFALGFKVVHHLNEAHDVYGIGKEAYTVVAQNIVVPYETE